MSCQLWHIFVGLLSLDHMAYLLDIYLCLSAIVCDEPQQVP